MFERFDEAAAYARKQGVTMVDLKFCDLAGRWRHVTLPAERFTPGLMEDGVGFDGSSVGLRSVKSGDLVLVPDLATGFLDPFPEEKTLSFLCRILEADDRSPVLFDPRTIAARAEQRLRASGVGTRSLWGPEFEFYLFDGVAYENNVNVASYRVESSEADWRSHELGSGFTIPRHGGYHALPPQDHLDDARTKISRILESVGVPVKYHHHEVGGPGQCEIEIPLRGLLDACDAVLMVKYVVRRAARTMGLTATFMPKPLYGEAGSGMHCHQLVLDGDRNVYFDPAGYGCVGESGRFAIGGLLHHGAAVMAFTNPSTNSYRRLVPGFEAPVLAIYSLGNRSAAIRIPKYANRAESARFEFRPPDATANPYLAMAAQLLAGLDGIETKMDPTALGFGPVDDDIFSWEPERRATIKALPTSLDGAMDALEADRSFLLEGGVFNDDLVERWTKKKRNEDREVRNRPHPYEIELYYGL